MKLPPTRSPPLRNNRDIGRATTANTNLKYDTVIYLRCIMIFTVNIFFQNSRSNSSKKIKSVHSRGYLHSA